MWSCQGALTWHLEDGNTFCMIFKGLGDDEADSWMLMFGFPKPHSREIAKREAVCSEKKVQRAQERWKEDLGFPSLPRSGQGPREPQISICK